MDRYTIFRALRIDWLTTMFLDHTSRTAASVPIIAINVTGGSFCPFPSLNADVALEPKNLWIGASR